MKIIIMSAGKGTRMMPLTKHTPKPLLCLENGNTLLDEQLERMEKSRVIDEVVLVIGHFADKIEAKLKDYRGRLTIKTIYNPFYEFSNNLISLWLAKHEMNEDFLITNGDNIFDPSVFTSIIESCRDGIFLTINRKETYDEDDMKVIITGDTVTRVHKEIPSSEADAESVGLVLVSGENNQIAFVETLEALARNKEYLNRYWLEIFNSLSMKDFQITPFEIDGDSHWQEFDFHWDIKKARKLIGISPEQ